MGPTWLKRLLKSEEAAYEAWEKLKAAGDASSATAFAEVSRARLEFGVAKVPLVVEQVLNDEGPVVLFAHHKAVVEGLAAGLSGENRRVVTVVGDMSAEERQDSVDAFQDGRTDVIIGMFGAMATGHTLVRSSHLVCTEVEELESDLRHKLAPPMGMCAHVAPQRDMGDER